MGSDYQTVTPSVPHRAAVEFWGVDQDPSEISEISDLSGSRAQLEKLSGFCNLQIMLPTTLNKIRIHPPVQTPKTQVTPMHSDHQDKGPTRSYFPSFCMRMQGTILLLVPVFLKPSNAVLIWKLLEPREVFSHFHVYSS